ncbi:MAG: heat-inducible transcription repressor HrcA [Clostridia bacterium]|nr:heat-inducible transcription repressor HrcA [Clostridia bacterium]
MSGELIYGGPLSERKKRILRSIIDAHIALGEPIGSKYLVTSAEIPFSSATIRNEMAELTEMGYLEQPHTSAGRVPTQLGYRFYVDSLMESYKLTATEIVALNNMLKSKIGELDTIIQSASKLVANLTNYTSVAIKASERETVRAFSHMVLDEHNFLMVMKMSGENVKTKQVHTDIVLDENNVSRLMMLFNAYCVNVTPDDITYSTIVKMESAMGSAAALVSPAVKAFYDAVATSTDSNVKFEGVNKLLEYPEFSSVDQLKRVFSMIENKEDFLDMLSNSDRDKINVFIGDEEKRFASNSAFIFRPLTVDGKVIGAIGVFGPSRMDYSKVISTVEYLTQKITGIIEGRALPEPGDE